MKRISMMVAFGAISISLLSGSDSASAKTSETSKTKQKSIVVTVKSGDTLESIAKKHKTTYPRLFNANKGIGNPDIIDVGDKVRIPKKAEKLKNRFAALQAQQVAMTTSSAVYAPQSTSAPPATVSSIPATNTYTVGSSAGNTYYAGYCTWYAKDRRPDLPNMLGNGGEWTANAAAQGFSTGSAARVGAVAETPGHVAYVEAVHGDGTMTISEMNGVAGFGNVGSRRVPTAGNSFIY